MNIQQHIDQLISPTDSLRKIEAARCLAPYTDDSHVMDMLCAEAVYTTSNSVREVLIDVLKTNPAGAYQRFSNEALWSKNPAVRKWALANLSLMGCREAKNAVISGLHDPDGSVRKAAALSTGLYMDTDMQNEFEHFFEKHRFDLALSFIADGLKAIRNGARRRDDDVETMTVLI